MNTLVNLQQVNYELESKIESLRNSLRSLVKFEPVLQRSKFVFQKKTDHLHDILEEKDILQSEVDLIIKEITEQQVMISGLGVDGSSQIKGLQ